MEVKKITEPDVEGDTYLIAVKLLENALNRIEEQDHILDMVQAEVEAQEKWLMEAGYNAYNVSIAFESIKRALKK